MLDVLIVDDHEAMRLLLRKVLERAGAVRVRDAANGAAGLAMQQEAAANLVLVDQMMPVMDGVMLTARLRKLTPNAKIIMITGHAEGRYADAARAAGADDVLVKPVAPSALIAAIERVFAP
jgi:CheY-like chemotaxis protein